MYDANGWEAMESAGAVFLPAAGYRNGLSIEYVNTRGYYWSSSADNTGDVYLIQLSDSYIGNKKRYPRDYGVSVRLVIDAN